MEIFGKRIKNNKIGESGSIGLAIVKKIILDNDGYYFIESQEGKGFKFFFSFNRNSISN
jgi:signal transduction histidine kinase